MRASATLPLSGTIHSKIIKIYVFIFLTAQRKKRNILKDEKKHYGAVDESSLEQQFFKLDTMCEKSGAILLVLVGLMAGQQSSRQSGEILVCIYIDLDLKILYRLHQ